MADTSKATKYDLIQRERVLDDIWLCSTRPTEKCFKQACKIHNPAACDGAGLPGVDWEDDDVFEPAEDSSDESPVDTSFSDSEVWDSDTDTIEEANHEAAVVNQEMERWMQVADMFYSQQDAAQVSHPPTYGMPPPSHPAYFPWNPAFGSMPPVIPMIPSLPGALPFPQPYQLPPYFAAQQQSFINANNRVNNVPAWPQLRPQPTTNQDTSSRGWDELIEDQERYQDELAAAIAAQTVGAMEECVTSSDNMQTNSVSYFSASTDF